jgi:hypothetical protein
MSLRSAASTLTTIPAMIYRLEKVERLPAALDDNVVYVSEEFELAALKCACGCGHRVNLLLGDGHTVNDVQGLADIWPSIGVWDAPCRSHFWIQSGRVLWAAQWSDTEIHGAMEQQLSRHLHASKMSKPWYERLALWLVNLFRFRK